MPGGRGFSPRLHLLTPPLLPQASVQAICLPSVLVPLHFSLFLPLLSANLFYSSLFSSFIDYLSPFFFPQVSLPNQPITCKFTVHSKNNSFPLCSLHNQSSPPQTILATVNLQFIITKSPIHSLCTLHSIPPAKQQEEHNSLNITTAIT